MRRAIRQPSDHNPVLQPTTRA